MSVQFGRWNFDGRPVDREYLAKADGMLAPYGPDGGGTYIKDSVGILFRAHHTTRESRIEAQPYITPSLVVLTWDGRLDNRDELVGELRDILDTRSSDVSIVAAAYERWGTACFAKLLGDWALSIWNPSNRSLILAKDPIGPRHLYYSLEKEHVTWSTILDPLVLLAGKTFALEEEYIAGWLSFFPSTHLTPYVGIRSVPPSSFVLVRAGKHTVSKYWDFDPSKRIRYRTDAEYEEHFRAAFGESVRRRLRSDRPVLAELSGGMDSSSIVCIADILIARGLAETPRLDTVSYYDNSEPNLNERPYFAKVEEKRGTVGRHIDFTAREFFSRESQNGELALAPGKSDPHRQLTKELIACVISQENRVVLSGFGGDEVAGGVPTPIPELQDLLAAGTLGALANRLKDWALDKRKPWLHLLLEAARGFLPAALAGVSGNRRPSPWVTPAFVKRQRAALTGYETRLKLFGSPPSFQTNLSTLHGLRRQLEGDAPSSEPRCEKRYPFLDRSLLEFMYAIPRDQVVRPRQRRSLMRRALIGIVPEQVLERKRKAFVARGPLAAISREWANVGEAARDMVSAALGVIDQPRFAEVLQRARGGETVPLAPIMRTLYLEFWLRDMKNAGILADVDPRIPRPQEILLQFRSQLRNTKTRGGENNEIRNA
jgi:asparagine synthase (glutamine-hydrolysing)